ncbi:signal peptidase I [Candidatus Dojkabacteria bacterium]|uniref:Signal peptidase I n=1 Tax=Candidatus Dojkabacteria bacterium TaxID=2099670 RepID=A0A955I0Y2_9BACT|nr:signal peptidase I [Candidatus Dojkabacteria bacterium]
MRTDLIKNLTLKNLINPAKALLLFLIFTIGTLIILSMVENPFGIRSYTVLTGSMEPAIQTGSIIFTYHKDEYKIGDIITYKPTGKIAGQTDMTLTHRIVKIDETPNGLLITTKGDANAANDYDKVSEDQIIGSSLMTVPYLGFVVDTAKKPLGFVALVVIPSTILIYEELRKIRESLKSSKGLGETATNNHKTLN